MPPALSFRRMFAPLLAATLLASAPAPSPAAERARAAVVALGLWDDPVFRSEAEGAARVLAARFGRGGPVVVLANSRARMVLAPDGIARALAGAARRADPERDVLVLVLTSHGGPDGIADKGGGREGTLTPGDVGALLRASPFRHKVLVVSACYSGIFTGLADADTLVVTAADASHPSFGCQPEAHWTYFGDAFFNQALRRGAPWPRAFDEARAIVAAREAAQGFEPSNPQIAGGEAVLPLLDEGR